MIVESSVALTALGAYYAVALLIPAFRRKACKRRLGLGAVAGLGLIAYTQYAKSRTNRCFAHGKVFDCLDAPLFIVGTEGQIKDANRRARRLDPDTDFCRSPGLVFEGWLADWAKRKGYGVTTENENTYLTGGGQVLKLNKTFIRSGQGQEMGCSIELANCTEERKLMWEMQRLASTDGLTGLGNRAQYDASLCRMDQDRSQAIGVMMIDINGLKLVNDRYGHKKGDLMILTVTAILKGVLPPSAKIFRIGGDEFVALLPQITREELDSCVEKIIRQAAEAPRVGEQVSVAVGAALREDGHSSVKHTISLADQSMYQMKRDYYTAAGRNRRSR